METPGAVPKVSRVHEVQPGTVSKPPAAASKAPEAAPKPPATEAGAPPTEKQLPAAGTARRGRRKKGDKVNGAETLTTVKFFLGEKNSSSTTPTLGSECTSETDAMLDSFKGGMPFYRIETWHGSKGPVEADGSVRIVKTPVK
jgi:hypothetical protein